VQGNINLTNPDIAAQIAVAQQKRAEKVGISAEVVLRELIRLGMSSMSSYVTVNAKGEPAIDLRGLTEDQWAAVQEVTIDDYIDARNGDRREVRRTRIKLAPKTAPLQLIAQHLGMIKQSAAGAKKQVVQPQLEKPREPSVKPETLDRFRHVSNLFWESDRGRAVAAEAARAAGGGGNGQKTN
jgi:phage terminase small subunit